jgi:hypothetical protein
MARRRINRGALSRALSRAGNEGLREIAKNLSNPTELGRSMPADRATTPTNARETEVRGRTQIYTFFTVAGKQQLLYSADKWTKVSLLLENAGPVDISTSESVLPVLSGRGASLLPNIERSFTLSPGDRLTIASTTVNRVQVFIEPYPWLESMLLTLRGILGK